MGLVVEPGKTAWFATGSSTQRQGSHFDVKGQYYIQVHAPVCITAFHLEFSLFPRRLRVFSEFRNPEILEFFGGEDVLVLHWQRVDVHDT
jgi:hypothetical protein